ncbi:MAG: hypothetical protein JWP97_4471 [Labilithrix sp.]|nr:hypothetical protein [Labilithrix sp.]
MSASPTIVCPTCGASVPGRNGEPPKFCGQCGTTLGVPAGEAAAEVHDGQLDHGALGKTLLDERTPQRTPQRTPPRTPQRTPHEPPHESDAHEPGGSKATQLGMPAREPHVESTAAGPAGPGSAPALRTMLGMPASDLPPAPEAGARAAFPPAQKTMMGVAIPGIAPSQPALAAPGQATGGGADLRDLRSKQSTMLGVAIPGVAPSVDAAQQQHKAPAPYGYTAQGAPAPAPHIPSQVQNTALGMMAVPEVPIVPRPKTLMDEPLPAAPMITPKQGVSALTVVALVAALVVVLGGTLAFVALRHGAPLSAVPQLDENGKESLKVACPSCPDGTVLALGASTASVIAQNAVLPLPAPLTIGDNDLTVKIDRPGAGRDEDVKVHVPVAYRVRADLTTLGAKPPAITVRVEAESGTEVKVDGQTVTLDATGKGAYPVDLTKETEGVGEARPFERKIPFVITPKSGPAQAGELMARTAVLPLALDAPGAELYTDRTSVPVAGQTRAGAALTVDGQNAPVDAVGRFGVRVELASVGARTLEIVASAPPQAPRIAHVKVTRVASLADQARELEGRGPLAYDAFGANPAGAAGKAAVVEGEVVDARSGGGHTVLLVEAKRGCAKGASCLTRVLHGDEDKVARGDTVRAYGAVRGSVTASGKTVPEIDASLVMVVKAAK